MFTRKRLLLLPGALLCASVALAADEPVKLFQLDGNAAVSPSGDFTTAWPYSPCTYLNASTNTTFTKTCEAWNTLNGTGLGNGAGAGCVQVGNVRTCNGVPGSDGWNVRTFIRGINDE